MNGGVTGLRLVEHPLSMKVMMNNVGILVILVKIIINIFITQDREIMYSFEDLPLNEGGGRFGGTE